MKMRLKQIACWVVLVSFICLIIVECTADPKWGEGYVSHDLNTIQSIMFFIAGPAVLLSIPLCLVGLYVIIMFVGTMTVGFSGDVKTDLLMTFGPFIWFYNSLTGKVLPPLQTMEEFKEEMKKIENDIDKMHEEFVEEVKKVMNDPLTSISDKEKLQKIWNKQLKYGIHHCSDPDLEKIRRTIIDNA